MIDDIDRIMAVMATAFDPAYGEAWNRRQVEDSLTFANCHHRVIAADGTPCGDAQEAAGFFMSRSGFDEEELLLLAVMPGDRGRGLGRSLLKTLQSEAAGRGATRLLLEMRKGNPAENLYVSCGFQKIGERRDYYRLLNGERVDAITFAYKIV